MKTLTFPRFVIDLPEGWTEQSTYVFKDEHGQDFRATLVVTSEEAGAAPGLTEHVAAQMQLLVRHLDRMEINEPAKKAKVGGQPAVRVGFTAFGPDARRMQQVQFYLGKPEQVFTLTFTHTHDQFAGFSSTVDRIAAGFRLTG